MKTGWTLQKISRVHVFNNQFESIWTSSSISSCAIRDGIFFNNSYSDGQFFVRGGLTTLENLVLDQSENQQGPCFLLSDAGNLVLTNTTTTNMNSLNGLNELPFEFLKKTNQYPISSRTINPQSLWSIVCCHRRFCHLTNSILLWICTSAFR